MEFIQVLKTCLDFAIANGGTIQPIGENKFEIHSRTTQTEILIERTLKGVWQAGQIQNAAGEKNAAKEIICTEGGVLEFVLRFWNK